MKKLIVALLVFAMCMVAPAVAVEWDDLPAYMMVEIEYPYPPGAACGTFFDVYLDDDGGMTPETVYPGWCVQTGIESIKNTPYCGHMYSTMEMGKTDSTWNMVNWILNNDDGYFYGDVQAAIWMVLGQEIPPQYAAWDNCNSQALAAAADDSFVPGDCEVGAVFITACQLTGQDVIIEVPMPCTPPPVPEFPTLIIPVFLVGSIMVAASVLKKE